MAIRYNIQHDMDKDDFVTVYLTELEKDALRRYCDERNLTMSDWVGGLVWPALKQSGYLPESYARPRGM